MSFLTALSGLNAATSNLGVISNNIANANTAGFKESRAEFADVFNGGRIGTGVNVSDVAQQFRQGSVDGTGNPLDLAIDGQGFFQVRDQGGTYYTRAGQFSLDK
ncbi:MAG: flagellar hook-basal body complex protein, partial [Candidatus Competibacteraceae bacterium]|nr:flagellar hook-basal body complex protein [Candidatus Competibacteraceae bacterium]